MSQRFPNVSLPSAPEGNTMASYSPIATIARKANETPNATRSRSDCARACRTKCIFSSRISYQPKTRTRRGRPN